MRTLAPLFLLGLAACSTTTTITGDDGDGQNPPGAAGDDGSQPDTRPTFATLTDLGTFGLGASIALDGIGRAAVVHPDPSDPRFMLFDGTAWSAATKLDCCGGPYALEVGVDRVGRFWMTDTTNGFVTFDVAEPGASKFHAAKTTTAVGGSYYYPAVATLPDGRVRYAMPTASSTIALYESNAALTAQKALGSAGTFQSDTSELPVVGGASDKGSFAVHWPGKIQSDTTYSYKQDFYAEGVGWDGESAAPNADIVSYTVSDDGHALALYESGATLSISVRDPAAKKFSTPKTLLARDFQPTTIGDPSAAPAWLDHDGSFTVVVVEATRLSRFTIAPDGTFGDRTIVHTYSKPADPDTPLSVQVVERKGARFVTWRTFGSSPRLFGAFVDANDAWGAPVEIGPGAADYKFRWVADFAPSGKAIALLEPLDPSFCVTPTLRHYTPSLGWGEVELPPHDGCVWGMTAAIADDGSVSTLTQVGGDKEDKRVLHAVAK